MKDLNKLNLLGIVNARDFRDDVNTDIRVINNNKCPFIEYKKKSKNGITEINTVTEINVDLAKASDLEYLLKSRSWLSPERKFIDGKKNLCIMNDTEDIDFIPTIYTNENENEYFLSKNGEIKNGIIVNSIPPNTSEILDDLDIVRPISEEDLNKTTEGYISPINYIRKQISNFRAKESEERKKLNITEDTYYNIIQNNIDKISGGSVDIIRQGSGIYTNIINLNHYIDITGVSINKQNIIVKLGINYSKKSLGIVEKYYKEISFIPFSFIYELQGEVKAKPENFIREINNDVVFEFINGCGRVFTMNNDVTECIISFCNLNYE
jgi:hypothetical protein